MWGQARRAVAGLNACASGLPSCGVNERLFTGGPRQTRINAGEQALIKNLGAARVNDPVYLGNRRAKQGEGCFGQIARRRPWIEGLGIISSKRRRVGTETYRRGDTVCLWALLGITTARVALGGGKVRARVVCVHGVLSMRVASGDFTTQQGRA